MQDTTKNNYQSKADFAWKIAVLALLSILIYKVDNNKSVRVSGYVEAGINPYRPIPVKIEQTQALPVEVQNSNLKVTVDNYSIRVHGN